MDQRNQFGKLGRADEGRIREGILALNEFNSTPGEGTTRILFTECELHARAYIKRRMVENGLTVSEDGIGNIFGELPGTDPSLAPVWTGSHIDTVLNAGMFDGMAGVLAGIEALRLIAKSGLEHKRTLVAVVYTSEEPTRFGLSCLGSRAMAGMLGYEQAKELADGDGKILAEVLGALGYDPAAFDAVRKSRGDVFAAVELHIEQNSALEKAGKPIGIVKAICAPSNYDVVVTGRQSHAGGTSMADRRDAFAASCEIALALEELARHATSEYTTATVGRVRVYPNAVNVIPGRVEFSIDIRDTDFAHKMRLMEKLREQIRRIERDRGVAVEITCLNEDMPTRCDETINELLRSICREQGVAWEELISGAYHDSLMVGRFAPVSMLFVPSKGGISHSADEWTDFADIAIGTDVLASALLELSNLCGALPTVPTGGGSPARGMMPLDPHLEMPIWAFP